MTAKEMIIGDTTPPVAPLEMPRSDSPHFEWLIITPEVAKAWMVWNRNNRNVRKKIVASYATDMANSNWELTGESIKLSRPLRSGEVEEVPEGRILVMDGQHRLTACIASGSPFATLVAYGLEPKARRTMDTGLNRDMADVLKMEKESRTPVLGSVLRRVCMWDAGDRRFLGGYKPSHSELLNLFRTNPQAFRNAAEKGYWVRSGYPDLPPAIIGTAYYLCGRVGPENVPWFFAALKTGAGLDTENHPILLLRNRLTRDRVDKIPAVPHRQLGLIIRAWNAYRADEPLSRLIAPTDMPDPK